ncbi:beta-sandwich lipoprotein [Paenibacillus sp. FSL K6-2524]|uniref:beta-sandwich lipoprotein n=1 Tax=Paenibacillus sp. FSL K6-2524 TaxID=2954516 RepID=UPI0030F77C95
MKKISLLLILLILAISLTACTDADIASSNLSKAADNFEIDRRIVFYNGITDSYMLTIEGRCSLGNQDDRSTQVTVTCKTGDNQYKKHFLGLSDNVTYFAEQLEPVNVSTYHYRVTFKPQSIVPDVDIR